MKVTLDYDPTWKALDWAKKHCHNYITNALHQPAENNGKQFDNTKIDYFFRNENEALVFFLKWS